MSNIGFVYYIKGSNPGSLNAEWCHKKSGCGTGYATGGPRDGFAGEYVIDYFDTEGKLDEKLDLIITKSNQSYDVYWKRHGSVVCVGIGREVEGGLAVGWRGVSD